MVTLSSGKEEIREKQIRIQKILTWFLLIKERYFVIYFEEFENEIPEIKKIVFLEDRWVNLRVG